MVPIMPTYEFKDVETGEHSEHFLKLGEQPGYGEIIEIDGRKLERVVEGSANVVGPRKEYVTRVVPKHTPGFKHDKDGRCVVENRKQEAWYAKKTGMEWE